MNGELGARTDDEMGDETAWARRIDAAVDHAHDGFDPAVALSMGHRRMRRRRDFTALAAVALIGAGTLWALTPQAGDGTDDPNRVATMPPTLVDGSAPPQPEQALLRYQLNSGELVVRPGAVIERQVDDVVVSGLDSQSVAAVVSFQGQTWWAVAFVTPGLTSYTDQHLAIEGRRFEQWIREKVVLQRAGRSASSGWVRLDDAGKVMTEPGVEVIGEVSPARPDQAPRDALSAAGMVEVDMARLCFVVRRSGDKSDDFYVPETEHQGCGTAVPAISDAFGRGR